MDQDKDAVAILQFLKRRKEASIDDILQLSGAESFRVESVLFTLEQQGLIEFIDSDMFGRHNKVRVVRE